MFYIYIFMDFSELLRSLKVPKKKGILTHSILVWQKNHSTCLWEQFIILLTVLDHASSLKPKWHQNIWPVNKVLFNNLATREVHLPTQGIGKCKKERVKGLGQRSLLHSNHKLQQSTCRSKDVINLTDWKSRGKNTTTITRQR